MRSLSTLFRPVVLALLMTWGLALAIPARAWEFASLAVLAGAGADGNGQGFPYGLVDHGVRVRVWPGIEAEVDVRLGASMVMLPVPAFRLGASYAAGPLRIAAHINARVVDACTYPEQTERQCTDLDYSYYSGADVAVEYPWSTGWFVQGLAGAGRAPGGSIGRPESRIAFGYAW